MLYLIDFSRYYRSEFDPNEIEELLIKACLILCNIPKCFSPFADFEAEFVSYIQKSCERDESSLIEQALAAGGPTPGLPNVVVRSRHCRSKTGKMDDSRSNSPSCRRLKSEQSTPKRSLSKSSSSSSLSSKKGSGSRTPQSGKRKDLRSVRSAEKKRQDKDEDSLVMSRPKRAVAPKSFVSAHRAVGIDSFDILKLH